MEEEIINVHIEFGYKSGLLTMLMGRLGVSLPMLAERLGMSTRDLLKILVSNNATDDELIQWGCVVDEIAEEEGLTYEHSEDPLWQP